MHYLITYDLRAPGQDYQQLIARLESLGAVRNLASTWTVYRRNTSASDLYTDLWRFMDSNDLLLVVRFDDWRGWVLDKVAA